MTSTSSAVLARSIGTLTIGLVLIAIASDLSIAPTEAVIQARISFRSQIGRFKDVYYAKRGQTYTAKVLFYNNTDSDSADADADSDSDDDDLYIILPRERLQITTTNQWFSRNKTLSQPSTSAKIKFAFKELSEEEVLRVRSFLPNQTMPIEVEKKIAVREAIEDPETEETFVSDGDPFNVRLNFTGTGPFKYCIKIYNHTEEHSYRRHCRAETQTLNNYVEVSRQLAPGNYTLHLIVNNIASELDLRHLIVIYERSNFFMHLAIGGLVLATLALVATLFTMRSKILIRRATGDIEAECLEPRNFEMSNLKFWKRFTNNNIVFDDVVKTSNSYKKHIIVKVSVDVYDEKGSNRDQLDHPQEIPLHINDLNDTNGNKL